MTQLVKSLIPLCILLLSGYLQQDGRTFYELFDSSLVKNVNCFASKISHHSVTKPVLSSTKAESKQIHITDIEEKENETISFKKNVSFSNKIAIPFDVLITEYHLKYTKIHSFFFYLFSYYPFCKSLYLKFEAMRI